MSNTLVVAIIAALGAALAAVLSYLGGKFAVNQSRRANVEDRDAEWNAGYRAAAEPHLFWDVARAGDINQLRQIVNRLEVELGHEPTEFAPIPPPPALFPKFEGKAK